MFFLFNKNKITSVPDALDWLNKNFKILMINMFKNLQENIYLMGQKMGYFMNNIELI